MDGKQGSVIGGVIMKEYQNLIGKIIVAVAIIIAAFIIANAIEAGCASIGSQIASAIANR